MIYILKKFVSQLTICVNSGLSGGCPAGLDAD